LIKGSDDDRKTNRKSVWMEEVTKALPASKAMPGENEKSMQTKTRLHLCG
jgi:hypothetical protein